MGYNTDFSGSFELDKPLSTEHKTYLETFAGTRRMGRDVEALKAKFKGAHGLNGDYGRDGEYFAFDDGDCGQSDETGLYNFNRPPGAQAYPQGDDWKTWHREEERRIAAGEQSPGLWCQWVPNPEGTAIVWDEGEKFREYIAWIKYLIRHFIGPWGYVLNGSVFWAGDEQGDLGEIEITNNEVRVKLGKIVYEYDNED